MLKTRILPAFGGLLALIIILVLARTFMPAAEQGVGESFDFTPDSDRVARLMSESVRYKTISYGRDKPTSSKALLAYLNLHLFQHHVLLLPKMQMTKWKEIMNLQALVIYRI